MTADGQRVGRLVRRDAIVVAGYLLVIAFTGTTDGSPETFAPPWVMVLLLIVTVLPAAVRRLWPLPVFCWVLSATGAAILVDALRDPFLPAAFTLYTVAVEGRTDRWWQRWLPGLAILGLLVCAVLGLAPVRQDPAFWWTRGPGLILLGCAALLGAWELGRAARERRAFALRTAEELARRAVTEERLRIARELHDVITHSMGLIVVRAGVANHVVRTRPEDAHEALRVIEATGRGALTELRRMLGVLRSESGERLPAALGPAPGVEGLRELARRSGAELTARDLSALPEGVGLAVHRIVQEALTNVLRHAGPGATSRVSVLADDGVVRLTVSDDGPPRTPGRDNEPPRTPGRDNEPPRTPGRDNGPPRTPGRDHEPPRTPGRDNGPPLPEYAPEGHGIAGMRERVAVHGGTFTAGPRDGGGFEVRATIPYTPVAPHGEASA
ncbi:histidine kinase [Streptomyces sp. NPDC055078]